MGNALSNFGSGDNIPDIPLDLDCKYIYLLYNINETQNNDN
jgi:hypothetical protein